MADRVQRLSRRLGCANSRWQVYLDHISDGAALEVPDYLVVETTLGALRGRDTGIVVLPVVDSSFALLRTYRHAVESSVWEAPRGFIDAGETAEATALRELEEEAGLLCRPEDLVRVGSFHPEASTLAARVGVFVATRCRTGGARQKDEIGLGEATLFTDAEMRRLVAAGEIQDAGTLLAYLLYSRKG